MIGEGGVQDLLSRLASDPNTGIMGDQRDINRRHTCFGENTAPKPQQTPFWESLRDAFNDRILLALGICAVLSIITGMCVSPSNGWVEGVSILIAIALIVLISSCNDWSKDKKFAYINAKAKDSEVAVIRGKAGCSQNVSIWKLLVGDVILLRQGDCVPADCIIIEESNVVCDETNHDRSLEVKKNVRKDPFLYANTFLVSGHCKAMVAAVGEYSTRAKGTPELDTEGKTDLE